MKGEATGTWYVNLTKAPWTPPSWFFGFAWTTIMLLFSGYLAKYALQYWNKRFTLLFSIQILLNASWSLAFFNLHLVLLGLFIIMGLTILISYILFRNIKRMNRSSLLLAPYFIWLLIATSLNAYILLYNNGI
jgi:tryptophan-rich sensory protein